MHHYSLNNLIMNSLSGKILESYTLPGTEAEITVRLIISEVKTVNNCYIITLNDEKGENESTLTISTESTLEVYPNYRLSAPSKYKKKNYGDLIPVKEFSSMVEGGGFVDSDGDGYPVHLGDEKSYDWYYNVQQMAGMKNDPRVTHIMWFNK